MKKENLANAIFNELKNKILLNQLHQGEMISEKELAELYHVSRTPVRQALQRLEKIGLVNIKDGVGTFVTMIDRSEMDYAYQIRCAIEKIAIQTAINKIPLEKLNELEEKFIKFKNQLINGGYGISPEEIAHADWELHDMIIEYSDNTLLDSAIEQITFILRRYQYAYLSAYLLATNEHIEIIKGIKDKDIKGVCSILDEHLRIR